MAPREAALNDLTLKVRHLQPLLQLLSSLLVAFSPRPPPLQGPLSDCHGCHALRSPKAWSMQRCQLPSFRGTCIFL